MVALCAALGVLAVVTVVVAMANSLGHDFGHPDDTP